MADFRVIAKVSGALAFVMFENCRPLSLPPTSPKSAKAQEKTRMISLSVQDLSYHLREGLNGR